MASSYYKLNIKERTTIGGKFARAMRREGQIPAVLYYAGSDTVSITIDKGDLFHALKSGQHIFEIETGGDTQFAMIKQVQYHPVTDDVVHLDLMRVRRSEKMNITVPLVLEGEALGIKEGGVLSQQLMSIEIKCLPTDVPEQIPVDISNLEMNASISVADITTENKDIEIVTAEDVNIASIHPPAVEEEPVEEIDEELEGDDEGDSEKADGADESSSDDDSK
ncbi:MAG: 50S ribosomal protein L25 [Candidatus Marinimicrobia bacterium]|jgi:large subunit ribosomal protein L25|nr:50S ribosomal protein L25 [Candidatus Neomarinimicrobiota bacterium]MBT3495748.1 50S ribosomal protein L25 [Candidatus Neomarinimicrobiota bacterium]MBT3692229.1 50S ribosomal protein L25 [Candidatus Neomarinimicrobiota bacterium]MBT3731738.1 50S ribosomal protein L25 [Candidatus Neomarinimicrobiota bacterium]MBT4143765.1 50S ribosomal protein L25 [Candidatus Neomarinimicrobiota bacterium]